MTFLERLEKRYGRFAIPGLIRIVVAFNALVYILQIINPYFVQMIDLDPAKIMEGEVWRLVSFVFIPRVLPGGIASPIFILLALYILWIMGEGLEEAWGAFRLNLFYLCGMLGLIVAAFGFGGVPTNLYLNLSIFFGFATLYPNHVFYLFLILPVKVKWLAWLAAVFFVFLPLLAAPWSFRLSILAGLANYLLFFGPGLVRNWKAQQAIAARRRRFEEAAAAEQSTLHRCEVCHRTEVSDPDLDFRVSADGNEYCEEHLPGRNEPGAGQG